MSLTDRELARWTDGGTLTLRPAPLRARWEINDLLAADGHRMRAVFTCSVQAVDRPADRQMLAETFGGTRASRPGVTVDDVAAQFSSGLAGAAAQVASRHPVEQWLTDGARPALTDALRQAAQSAAFAAGLEVLPPFQLELDSPTLRQQKIDALHRQLTTERTASRLTVLQQAEVVLRQFAQLRETSPALSPGQMLERFAPADRGGLLETLLMASDEPSARQSLWLVAGANLYRLDPRDPAASLGPLSLSADVGPLRSVTPTDVDGRRVLLLGGRRGVAVVDPADPGSARSYVDPDVSSALGFNRAVLWHGRLYGTHGDAGVVAWDLDESSKPALTVRPTSAAAQPRHQTALDASRLVYSTADGSLMTLDREGHARRWGGAGGAVAELLVHGRELLVVRADGEVLRCGTEGDELPVVGRTRYADAVQAAALLPWVGDVRLLLATSDGPVCCVGLDDSLVTQYLSPHRGLRTLAATARTLAAVSADRQRLVLWNSWDGQRPAREVNVAAVAQHRIADVCFA